MFSGETGGMSKDLHLQQEDPKRKTVDDVITSRQFWYIMVYFVESPGLYFLVRFIS